MASARCRLGVLICLAVGLLWIGVGAGLAAAPPPGALLALRGTGGCLGGHCREPLRPFSTWRDGLGPLHHVGIGRRLYVVQNAPAVLDVLARDPETGALTQLPGHAGCFTARRVRGCATVAAWHGHSIIVRPDGTIAVHLGHFRTRFQRIDPATGRLRRGRVVRGCLGRVGRVCISVPGTRYGTGRDSLMVGSNTVVGGGGAGLHGRFVITLLNRVDGGWHRVPGRSGCVSSDPKVHACATLRCLDFDVSAAHLSDDGRDLYVVGGDAYDRELDGGFVATLRRTPNGGMRPLGCVKTGPHRHGTEIPEWVSPLPHSRRVLVAEVRGDYPEVPAERIYATHPGADGALVSPHQISKELPFQVTGQLKLSRDGRMLYSAEYGLEVLHVTASRVRRLPGRWANVFRRRLSGLVTNFALPGDGRTLYLMTQGAVRPYGHPTVVRPYVRAMRVVP